MDKESIDIEKEQQIMRQKIQDINDSGIFNRVYEKLSSFSDEEIKTNPEENIALMGRVKNPESACEKIVRQGLPASQIYDLIGFMYVVDLPEQYIKAKQTLMDGMPKDSFIHDFDGSLPENNGYSSFHMGVQSDKIIDDGENLKLGGLSIEIQLKTYGMYIAQEVTHDSIYKNPSLSKDDKDNMQTVMFPMIEKIINIQAYQEQLAVTFDENKREEYRQKIFSEEQDILRLKMNHKEFINQNSEQVQDVLKEFILVQYMEKIKNDPLLAMENIDKNQVKSNCRKVIEVLARADGELTMSDSKPTGFGKLDEIYNQIMNCSIEEIQELSLEEKEHEEVPKLLRGAVECSRNEISSSDIETMVNTVKSKTQERDTQDRENNGEAR